MSDPKLMTYGEAALRLGCGLRTVKRYAALGLLKRVAINKRVVRVTAASVERVFSATRRTVYL